MKIIHETVEKMTKIYKPQQKFITSLLSTILSMGGRMNFRNMARYANYDEKTFSRNFEKEFDYFRFNCLALGRIISNIKRLAIGYDPFFIEKSGKKTYGKEKFWNGSSGKAEMGLEGNGFALIDVDRKIAYPLAVQQTPPKNAICELIGSTEATRMDFYVECARDHLRKLKASNIASSLRHLVFDTYFSVKKFVSMALSEGYHVVGKLRCNVNLRSINSNCKTGKRGRPKKYGNKIDAQNLNNYTFVCNIAKNEDLYEGTFYSINLECVIKVACLVTKRKSKVGMVLMFSTDLALSAQDIHDFYRSRFQIEFVFRDGKQFVGLTECQARSKEKIHHHLNASASALLIAKIQEAEARADAQEKVQFSMQSHKRKNYNEMLVNLIFSILGLDQSLIKLHPGDNECNRTRSCQMLKLSEPLIKKLYRHS
jgi:hypothetical protein